MTSAFRGSAPGRVNLIGEHTDYNGGFVLPTAIPQRTRVEVVRRGDRTVRAQSDTPGADAGTFEYRLGEERKRDAWIDYVQGITDVLARAGHQLRGFDLAVRSDVPIGSGLSSSAALEISLLRALREAFSLAVDDVAMARLGRRAENEFVGAPVGIMDQMACALADERTALFLDTRHLTYERVPLPEDLELAVINSGVVHSHAGGEYRTRRQECEAAAAALGVKELRDCTRDDLARVAELPAPMDRRARHVITENQRVLDTVSALRARDFERVGALLNASHASMRDDFEVSIPEIDLLVTLATAHPAVFGARLTGGGFGGSIVLAARRGSAARVSELIVKEYGSRTVRHATVLVPAEVGGGGMLLGSSRADDTPGP